MTKLPTSVDSLLERNIEDFLTYMEVEKGSSPLTIRNYRHYLKRFSDWIKEKNYNGNPEKINSALVTEYRVYLSRLKDQKSKTLSRKTQGYHAIALRSFFKYLTKKDVKVMAPDKIELPKIDERQIKFLTGEQVDRLLSSPSLSKIQGLRDKTILEVLYSTGLRVSELVKMDRDKLDLERREFGILGKGGKVRIVFLSMRACEWIKKYLGTRKDKYKPLFIRHKGKTEITKGNDNVRLSVRSVQRIIKRYAKKINLPIDVTPHVLRHSFATDLLIAGADIRSVQEMLGHKNIQTTQVYTHVTHKHLKEIHDAYHAKGKNNN